jgi:MFS family permease
MTRSLVTPRFVLAWFVSFFGGLAFFLFVHFPGYLEDLGASEFEIGLIVGVTAISAIVIRPRLGKELDRRGRRPVILTGGIINALVLIAYLTVSSIGPWLYVIRIVHGFAEAILFSAVYTYAADIVPDHNRTQGLALFGVSGMLPIAVGGMLGDFVLAHWDFHTLFLISAVLAVVALGLSLPLAETVTPAGNASDVSFVGSLTQRNLVPLWWMTLVFSLALSAYFTFLRTFIDETGIGTVGAFFAAYSVTAVTLRLTLGWLPDRIGAKRVLFPALTLFAMGFVLLAGATSGSTIVIAGALCGAGHGYAFPILYAMAFDRADRHNRGSASTIYTGLFDVGALIGGPVFGLVITTFSYEAMFLSAAAWVVAGGIVFARWDKPAVSDQQAAVSGQRSAVSRH